MRFEIFPIRLFQRPQDVAEHSDADGGIRDVERREDVIAEVEIEEIGHMAVAQAVDEIADGAATEQAKAELRDGLAQAEVFSPDEDRGQRAEREDGEHRAAAAEHAPGRTGIAHVYEIEKSRKDRDAARTVAAERHPVCDPDFAELIGNEDQNGTTP